MQIALEPRAVALDNAVSARIDSDRVRTFVQYCAPYEGFQGTWVELTTFVGRGVNKRRLDFAWPTELFDDFSDDEIVGLVVRAYELTRRK